jgi:hypothetical protein
MRTDDRRGPLLAVALYLLLSVGLLAATGHLQHLATTVDSSSDAQGYLEYARFLLGHGPVPAETIALRPVGFPLVLAGILTLPKPGVVLLGTQLLLNALTLLAIHRAVRTLTKSPRLAFAGLTIAGLNLSLIFLTVHALTEPLGTTLVAIAVLLLARDATRPSPRSGLAVLICLGVAVLVKPILLPFLGGWLVVLMVRLRRSGVRPLHLIGIASTSLPLAVQLLLTTHWIGRPVLSEAGSYNLTQNVYPLVVGIAETGRGFGHEDPRAELARRQRPSMATQLGYLASHPGATAQAGLYLAQQNLLTGSIFVAYPPDVVDRPQVASALAWTSRGVNGLLVALHVLVALVLIRERGRALTPATRGLALRALPLGASILALSLLTYRQGDRVVLLALPVWAVTYPILLHPRRGGGRGARLTSRAERAGPAEET